MKRAKLIAFLAIVVALAVANYFFSWSDWIVGGSLSLMLEGIVGENLSLAIILYVVLSIVGSVVLALPGVIFALIGGVVFGPILGTLLCWLSMSIGAWGSFLVGRYFLKDSLKPRLARNRVLNRFLFEGADRSDVFLLAITRLVPVFPFNLQNFAYGITDIKFAPYALYTALFILPGTAAYTIGAAGIAGPDNRVLCIVVSIFLIVASLFVAWLLKRKAGLS